MTEITFTEINEMQLAGIQVPMEFVLKKLYKFNKKQIQEFKAKQLEDAAQRHKIVVTESNGLGVPQVLNENIIPITKYGDYTGISPEIV